ncbi:MAG: MmgE/PrpD family protein, partial [Nitrospirota bacterium]|nr:MmgE/PrpD family protein [Nitrospirota bacterium]
VSKIEGIRVRTSDISYEIIGNDPDKWHPKSRETADHSLPYIVAVALMDGKVGLSQFNTRHLNNPNLSALIQKVRIFSDKQHSERYGETMGNTVSVKISGKTYTETVDIPKGFPGNPLTDAEIEEKFHRLAKPLLSENIRLKILDQLWQVEKIKSVSTLLSLFHVKGKA